MNKSRFALLLIVCLCCALFASCSGGGSQVQSGFRTMGQRWVQVATVPVSYQYVSPTNIQGQWQFDLGTATGSVQSFGPLLCLGECPIEGGRVPARWNIVAGLPTECIGYLDPISRDVGANSTQYSRCVVFGIIFPFTPTPGLVDLQAPPATLEMNGEGLTTVYGMPYLEYRDPYTGNVVGSTYATAVGGKGRWLQATTPDLSSVYSGMYHVFISNFKADGTLELVGTSTIEAFGRDAPFDPPPDPGPCGCPPDLPCMPCENQ